MPYAIVRAYSRMMPRLLAEESQRMSERVFIGSHRNPDTDDFKDIQRGWMRDAQGDRAPSKKRERLSPQLMGDMGIGYRVVERHG